MVRGLPRPSMSPFHRSSDMIQRRTTGFDRPPGPPRPTLFHGGVQRSAVSIPLPPLGTQGRILLVQCAVAAGEGAVATRDYFEKGLSDLGRTQIPVNYPCEFGDRHAFSVSGGVRIVKPRLGDLVQARLVVHPDAVPLFANLIDAEDNLSLPSPFAGIVTAKWVDERKQSMRMPARQPAARRPPDRPPASQAPESPRALRRGCGKLKQAAEFYILNMGARSKECKVCCGTAIKQCG